MERQAKDKTTGRAAAVRLSHRLPFGVLFPRASRILWGKPARILASLFGAVILLGTGLLLLPVAQQTQVSPVEALFTATSALCVAGLSITDPAHDWSFFGQLVILGLIQVGGIGIMTLASLLGMVVIRRFGLRMQLSVQSEQRTLNVGGTREESCGVLLRPA